ncbi:MAG TPA: excinuclease ABC subunit UvrC [Candidatus Binataceae bacterium]|nr:excinuclease ABC subunit UvrC [Candidatus Binataceae bacterium]
MVRAAEGLHVRPFAARDDAGDIDGDAAAATRSTGDRDAGAQGDLALPVERRRWDSLVSYPGDAAAASGDAPCAPPDAAAAGAASAGGPADGAAEQPASSAAQRAADDAALERKLDAIPAEPGVYLLRERAGQVPGKTPGKVLYVGKAKSLRSRVRAYFRESGDTRFQVRFLMKRVGDFDVLVARSEKEALILENNLIKQYRPRYNIRLKDDKSYLSAKMTNHPWPRIMVTRKIVRDGGKYFGPFGSADGLRETIDVIRKVFPLRTCSDAVFRNRSRPCIEYQIKRCLGPCCLPVDRAEYEEHLHAAQMLLEGRNLEVLKELRERMRGHAERLEFEEAARLRDQVRAIEKTVERQTVLHHWGIDQDVFGLYREGGFIEAIVLMVRGGKLTSTQGWSFHDLEFADEDIFADLLTQFYAGARIAPDEVIVPVALEDADVRAELLTERRGKKVEFLVPQRGEKLRLLEMAMDNARQSFAARRDNENTRERMLEELRTRLHLRNTPKRIECYDISNLQGSMVVGSQATFDEGEPRKDLYRRYRIRTVEGQDDFASMYEVLSRRLKRATAGSEYPDLWVIDGGKGQLNVALEVLRECGLLDQIDVISLAKQHVLNDPRERAVVKSEERVFLPNRKDPIVLPRNSTALFLLVRIRDEAHRFAITYNRELRRRSRLRSVLDDIAGIGPVRRRGLLRHFGSLKRIRAAGADEIALVKGMNRDLAAEVRRYLDTMGAMLEEQERAEAVEEDAAVAAANNAADDPQLELIPEPPSPGHAEPPRNSD